MNLGKCIQSLPNYQYLTFESNQMRCIGLIISFWYWSIFYIAVGYPVGRVIMDVFRCSRWNLREVSWTHVRTDTALRVLFLISGTSNLQWSCGSVTCSYKKKNNNLRRRRIWQLSSVIDFEKSSHLEPQNRDSSSYMPHFSACAYSL